MRGTTLLGTKFVRLYISLFALFNCVGHKTSFASRQHINGVRLEGCTKLGDAQPVFYVYFIRLYNDSITIFSEDSAPPVSSIKKQQQQQQNSHHERSMNSQPALPLQIISCIFHPKLSSSSNVVRNVVSARGSLAIRCTCRMSYQSPKVITMIVTFISRRRWDATETALLDVPSVKTTRTRCTFDRLPTNKCSLVTFKPE